MNSDHCVSIGIPFFNAEGTILDSVRSVFCQTHQDWELILLDDGSNDQSLSLVRSIDDPRVKVHSDGLNKGLAARLNEIVRLARFDFIARMDADDLMAVDRIERQLQFLRGNPDVDLVSSGVLSLADDYSPTGVRCVSEGHEVSPWRVLSGQSGIVHAAVLGRRSWFLEHRYDERFRIGEDTDLWLRSFSEGALTAKVLGDPLYFYREDGNVTYPKLRDGYRNLRKSVWNHRSSFGLIATFASILRVYLKSCVAWTLWVSGKLDLLRQRRNSMPLTSEKRKEFDTVIAKIRSTYIPIR
jgi:glycosyltransferase involved in cell wall biosynthesis